MVIQNEDRKSRISMSSTPGVTAKTPGRSRKCLRTSFGPRGRARIEESIVNGSNGKKGH